MAKRQGGLGKYGVDAIFSELKEDSENDAKEMGRSCYSHSIGCAYGGNNTYGFA